MADDVSQRVAQAAKDLHQISSNINAVASAAEELSGSVSEISDQTAYSAKIAAAGANEASGADGTVQELALWRTNLYKFACLATQSLTPVVYISC